MICYYKKIRVIVDTDAACEADDPFAIVHALLSPKLIVKGVVAEHFNVAHSMEDSYNEILTIKQAMAVDFPAFMGQTGPLSEDTYVSEGVDFIIKEALTDSPSLYMRPVIFSSIALVYRIWLDLKKLPDKK